MKHYLGICLVLLTLAGIVLFMVHSCTVAVDHTIASVRDGFAQALRIQPTVTVNQRVVLTQTAPIAELAVVTKEEVVTLGFDYHLEVLSFQVPLTEKKMTAEAIYRLKAGFDLRELFDVEINAATGDVRATLPHAKILSVEQEGDLTYKGDDALMNRITDAEREEILNNLNHAAHDVAEASTLKADAEKQVGERLKELIRHNGQPIEIEWTDSTKSKAPSFP